MQAQRQPLSQWLFASLTYLILSNNQIPNHILVRYGTSEAATKVFLWKNVFLKFANFTGKHLYIWLIYIQLIFLRGKLAIAPLFWYFAPGIQILSLANFNHRCSTTVTATAFNHCLTMVQPPLATVKQPPCPPPPPQPLFLMDNIKMDGIQIKIKWKIHVLFTL